MHKFIETITKLASKTSFLKYAQLLLIETHFKRYLNEIELIATKTSPTSSKAVFSKLNVIFFIMGQQCFHLTLFACRPAYYQDKLWRLLHYDPMYFLDLPAQFNLCLVPIFLQAAAFLHLSYYPFKTTPKSAQFIVLVKNVLYRNDDQYFLQPTIELPVFGKRKAFHANKVVQKVTQNFMLNCYYYPLFFTFYAVSFHFISAQKVIDNFDSLSTLFASGMPHLAFHLLSSLLFDLSVITLVIIQTTVPAVLVAISATFFVRLRQIEQRLFKEINQKGSVVKVRAFTSVHTDTFLMMMAVNGYYGRLLLIFILLTLPVNVYTSMLLASGQLGKTTLSEAFFAVLSFSGGTGFICFHYLAAWYTKILHKPCSRHLPSLMARSGQKLNRKDRLLLHHYILKFALVKRRYGITYASFGLVSFTSFTKFVLLYSELTMYCYKRIQYTIF